MKVLRYTWGTMAMVWAMALGGAAHGQAYTNWTGAASADPEWIALTNHIAWVHGQINARCQILGMDPIAPPCYERPTEDYRRFSEWIDQNATNFVDYTLSTDGSFNGYFSNLADDEYPNDFPMLSAEKLHTEACFTEWAHPTNGLSSWAAVEHKKEWLDQIVSSLPIMKWTKHSAQWVDAVSKAGIGGADMESWSWDDAIEDATENYGQTPAYTNGVPAAPEAVFNAERTPYGMINDLAMISIWKTHAVSQVCCPYPAPPANVQIYFAVYPALTSYYDGFGYAQNDRDCGDDNISDDGDLTSVVEEGSGIIRIISANVLQSTESIAATTTNYLHRVHFGDENFNLPPACDMPLLGESCCRGYSVGGPMSLFKWDVPGGLLDSEPPPNPYAEGGPGADPAKAWIPDTDRDDLVDIGTDICSVGSGTGVMLWQPAQDEPYVVLPLEVRGDTSLRMVKFITATTVLPYQYQNSFYRDEDGFATACSSNTRILESVVYAQELNGVETNIKRVSLMRPRGQVVVFDFPCEDDVFSATGYPTGIHASRTYVLRDRTPDDDTDEQYDLMFDSGIVHVFNDGLQRVENALHQRVIDFSGAAYCTSVEWSNDRPIKATYHQLDNAAKTLAQVNIGYDDQDRITSLSKLGGLPGVEASDAALSSDRATIVFGDSAMTSTRSSSGQAGEARTITITTQMPDCGAWSVTTGFNADDYPVSVAHSFGAHEFTREFAYAQEQGRYTNGLLKKSRLTTISDSEGSHVAYEWMDDTGWLQTVTEPTAWGDQTTTFSYQELDSFAAADPTRLVELPRLAVAKVGTTETSRRHTQYQVDGQSGQITITQRDALAPAAGWDGDTYETIRTLSGNTITESSQLIGERVASYNGGLYGDLWGAYTGPEGGESVSFDGMGHPKNINSQWVGYPAVSYTCAASDAHGRPTRWNYPDGSYREVLAYDFFGPSTIRERDGSIRTLTYDNLGRVTQDSYLGRQAQYVYDPLGRVTQTTLTEGGENITIQAQYDILGRVIQQTTPLGTRDYTLGTNGGLRSWTMTDDAPITGDVTMLRHPDGLLARVSGTGVAVPVTYTYGFHSCDGQAMRTITETRGASEWTRTYYDMLGCARRVDRSGQTNSTLIERDEAGRLKSITDPIGKRFLVEYEANGIFPTAMGMDRSGSPEILEPGGLDRRHNLAMGVGTGSYSVYPNNNQSGSLLMSSSSVAADGLSATATYAGRTATAQRGAFAAGGACTVTTALPGNKSLETVYDSFRPASVELRENGVKAARETYAYFPFGLLEKIQSDRNGITRIDYDECKRIEAVENRQGRTTLTYYDHTDWIKSIHAPGEPVATYDYHPNGQVKSVVQGLERLDYDYDRGRMSRQRLYHGEDFTESTWTWDAQTGRLNAVSRPGQGTWSVSWKENGDFDHAVHPLGATLTAQYTHGDMTGLTYNDGVTSALGYTLDRLGRVTDVGCADGVMENYGLALDGSRLTTNVTGPAAPAHSYEHAWDASGDTLGWTLHDADGARARAISRFGGGWVGAISEPGVVAFYTTATNAPGIAVCEIGDVRAEYQWDRFGARLTNLVWKVNDTAIASFAQTYPANDIHRIERRERLDGSHWDYLYDGVGRLTNAVLRVADGNVAPGGRYAYEWDDAGNPVRGGPVDGDEPRWSFEHNTGNLQVRRVWGNQVEILGEAAADATVGVSLDGGAFGMVERQGERYRFLGAVPGLAASAMDLAVEIVAVRQEGPNEIVQRTRGRLYVPKADETAEIDIAGQLSETSRWEYTWNLRGQLIRVESRHRSPNVRLDYDYYPSGPMARRICSEWANGAWAAAGTNQWIVDGWRPVKEIERTASATMVRRYIWGLDLAGVRDHASMDAAGGIGGLLAVCEREDAGPETTRYVISDPQGNVMALADAAGTLVARYDYDPFGRLIMETGEASTCPFRYSTKYRDPDLDLYYYGHRWYDPAAMKWLTPDPIGERGGVNLTAFCRNDPVNNVDPLGLFTYEGMYEEFLTKYGDKGLKLLGFLAAEGWDVEGRDFFWSRTSFDEQAKVLALELDWSDKKAADKLFKALSSRYDKGFGRFLRGAGSVYGASIVAAQEMGLEGYENAWTGIEAELGRIGSQAQQEVETEAKFALLTAVGFKTADLAIDAFRARRLAQATRVVTRSPAWSLGLSDRGVAIERAWGHNLPKAFKTWDRFENGVATSFKSIDLDLPSFRQPGGIWKTGKGAVDAAIDFEQYQLKRIRIDASMIQARQVRIAVPRMPTATELGELNRLKQYGADNGINVLWEVF